MGGDTWYGVPNYGEFVGVYYNKDAFAAARPRGPDHVRRVRRRARHLRRAGHHAAGRGRRRVPARPALVPARADARPTASSSTTTSSTRTPSTGRVAELTYATETIKDYVDKGYIASDVSSVKAEDMGVVVHQRHRPDLRLGLVVVRPLRRGGRLRLDAPGLPGLGALARVVGQPVGRARERGQQGARVRVHRHHDASRDPGDHRQQRRRPRRRGPRRHHRPEEPGAHRRRSTESSTTTASRSTPTGPPPASTTSSSASCRVS